MSTFDPSCLTAKTLISLGTFANFIHPDPRHLARHEILQNHRVLQVKLALRLPGPYFLQHFFEAQKMIFRGSKNGASSFSPTKIDPIFVSPPRPPSRHPPDPSRDPPDPPYPPRSPPDPPPDPLSTPPGSPGSSSGPLQTPPVTQQIHQTMNQQVNEPTSQ